MNEHLQIFNFKGIRLYGLSMPEAAAQLKLQANIFPGEHQVTPCRRLEAGCDVTCWWSAAGMI